MLSLLCNCGNTEKSNHHFVSHLFQCCSPNIWKYLKTRAEFPKLIYQSEAACSPSNPHTASSKTGKTFLVFENPPAASRPDSWCAQIPPFSGRGKKINQEPMLLCFLLYFTLITKRNGVTEKIQSKRGFSDDWNCGSAPKDIDIEPTWNQRCHFIQLLWEKSWIHNEPKFLGWYVIAFA